MGKNRAEARDHGIGFRDRLLGLWTAGETLDRAVATLDTIRARLDEVERENRILIRQMLIPKERFWQGQPEPLVDAVPAPLAFAQSCLCRAQHFRQPYFSYWTRELGEALRYHRKLWEFVFICQALYERGMIVPGSRALGFGVGEEPLSAYFAGRGVEVMATDMSADQAVAAGWTQTAEHAAGKESLRRPALCDDAAFEENVSFQTVDMNHVPDDLTGFDFCWSACALEHLGSIGHGLDFIERSLETLKPGGLAVHTTEFNLSSDADTLETAQTVLFRRRDIESLAERLRAKGHIVVPIDFHPGYGDVDRYVDVAPYLYEPHLKLMLEGYATTSIELIVQRRSE
ncbi:SAM-dependent methyltransferase [Brevundimonas sp. R86498]|uniref:SAM-dependent methyltransferase n=1 Tax=Brevundimonas sp. R86498 TaxID=3093845 RepID=UPI0037C4F793